MWPGWERNDLCREKRIIEAYTGEVYNEIMGPSPGVANEGQLEVTKLELGQRILTRATRDQQSSNGASAQPCKTCAC